METMIDIGKQKIPFTFYIYGTEDIPDTYMIIKDTWLYNELKIEALLYRFIKALKKNDISEQVLSIEMRDYFEFCLLNSLKIEFEIEEWYNKGILDKIRDDFVPGHSNSVCMDAHVFCGTFIINFELWHLKWRYNSDSDEEEEEKEEVEEYLCD